MFAVRAYEYLVCCSFAVRRHYQPTQPIRQGAFECVAGFSLGTASCAMMIVTAIDFVVFGYPVYQYEKSASILLLVLNFSLNWLAVTRLIGYDRIEERLKVAGASGTATMSTHASLFIFGTPVVSIVFLTLMYKLGR